MHALAVTLALGSVGVVGCGEVAKSGESDEAAAGAEGGADPRSTDAASTITIDDVQRRLLRGGGDPCQDDRACGKPGARGACVLGTCFGLLTTDSAAARAVLIARLAALPLPLLDATLPTCSGILWQPESMQPQRVAAAECVAVVAAARPQAACGDACKSLERLLDEPEPGLREVARGGLLRAGDAAQLPMAITDLHAGTEHTRAATLRALGALWCRPSAPADEAAVGLQVAGALQRALDDPSPMIRRIAAETLAVPLSPASVETRCPASAVAQRLAAETRQSLQAALRAAATRHAADLGYVVDRALPTQPAAVAPTP